MLLKKDYLVKDVTCKDLWLWIMESNGHIWPGGNGIMENNGHLWPGGSGKMDRIMEYNGQLIQAELKKYWSYF